MMDAWVRCCACNFQQKCSGNIVIPSTVCPKCGENKIDLKLGGKAPDWYVEDTDQKLLGGAA